MLDRKWLRDNPDRLREACRLKRAEVDLDRAIAADQRRRAVMAEEESLLNKRNATAKDIGLLKREGKDTSLFQLDMRAVADRIASLAEERRALEAEINALLLMVPNHPDPGVPVGDGEEGNVETARWGQPTEFLFKPKPHWELAETLGLFDLKRGSKVAGSGFVAYTGAGARLERALISYFLDRHTTQNGYTEIFPPSLVNRDSMTGTGQLPKFAEEAYACGPEDGLYLIPTAEVPVTNLHRDEIFENGRLPRYAAFSSCFRREAGAAGKDTRGLLRVHEFHKVELVRFSEPSRSAAELEELRKDVAGVFEALGLHYRIVELCTGDLGFGAAKCYDFEAWAPGVGKYLECSSCSNYTDFQARRMNIRCRGADGKPQLVHTLNASGLACPRTMVAILETGQQADGSVLLPPVLVPYMNGQARLTPLPDGH